MRLFGYVLLLILLAIPSLYGQSAPPPPVASEGRSFVLALPFTRWNNKLERPRPRLALTSRAGANVQLLYTANGSIENFTLLPGLTEEIALDTALLLLPEPTGSYRRTVQLRSTQPFAATLLADLDYATEAYAAIPDSMLGFEYFGISSPESIDDDFVVAVAAYDGTVVTVTRPSAAPVVVPLNRGEAFQLTSVVGDGGLGGTHVTANMPIGVFSGAACVDLRVGAVHSCNPFLEELPSADAWGTTHVLAPLAGEDVGVMGIVARCNNTIVRVNGGDVVTLNAGQTHQMSVDAAYIVTSTKPVMVVQMTTSTARGEQDLAKEYGDPSMMMVAPTWQWARAYEFSTPTLSVREAQLPGTPPLVGWRHFLQVALPASAEPGLRIDGAPPLWLNRTTVGPFVVGVQELSTGDHVVTAADSVCVTTYGYSAADAYSLAPGGVLHAFPLGAGLTAISCSDTFDTSLVVTNLSDTLQQVDGAAFIGALSGTVIDPAPCRFDLAPGERRTLRLKLGGLGAAVNSGFLVLFGGGSCPARVAAIPIEITRRFAELTPPAGSLVDFGVVPLALPFGEQTITITNRGGLPMTIAAPTVTRGFAIVAPVFPLVLQPGDSAQIVVRFTSATLGVTDGSAGFLIDGCSDTIGLALRGIRRRSGFLVPGTVAPVRLLCPPKELDTVVVTLRNTGDVAVRLVSAGFTGAQASEFTVLDPVAGRTIPPGDSIRVRLVYRPGGTGARDVQLTVTADSAAIATIVVPLDVRNDTIALDPLVDTIDLGRTPPCSPVPTVRVGVVNHSTYTVHPAAALETPAIGTTSLDRATAAPGDTIWLTVTLDASVTGAISDAVVLSAPECAYTRRVPVRGMRERAAATFGTDTFDLGTIPLCDSLSVKTFVFRNDGDAVDTITVLHAPAAPFEFDALSLPATIGPAVSAALRLRFRRAGTGAFIDSLVLGSRPCGLRRTLVLKGRSDDVRPVIAPAAVNFGRVPRGAPATRTVVVTNPSSLPLTIGAGSIGGGVRIVAPTGAVVIAPGDSATIELAYEPASDSEVVAVTLVLPVLAPCADTLRVAVQGMGEGGLARPVFRWEDAALAAGEEGTVRLSIQQGSPPITGIALRLDVTLAFNATLLLPLGVEPAPGLQGAITGTRISGGIREVDLRLSGEFPVSGPVADVRVRAMLGNADTTALAFGRIALVREPSTAIPAADSIAGIFRLTNVCRAGGPRLIGFGTAARIAVPVPHPMRGVTRLQVELEEAGQVVLEVVDAGGRRVAVLLDEPRTPGRCEVAFDTRSLAAGLYLLRLRTATETVERAVVVIR